jgi:putative transposase
MNRPGLADPPPPAVRPADPGWQKLEFRAHRSRIGSCTGRPVTIPRRVVPGTTYLLSRRTLGRHFYLLPSAELNEIYLYALAHAAAKHGVHIHGFGCMSNHPHEVVTDVRGVLPDFLRDLHREIALAAKQLYGIPENVWSAEPPSAVELHGPAAQLDAVLYTMLNPVAAGLVARAADWPGAISLPSTRRIEARRPDVWFSSDRPEVLTLELTPPPAWTGDADTWHAWLDENLSQREDEIRRERGKQRKPFLGRARVLTQRPFDRPRNPDELVPTRNPTLKTSGDGPLMRFAITALRAWRRAYREARARWCLDKTVGFPLGTWWVVKRAGAALA